MILEQVYYNKIGLYSGLTINPRHDPGYGWVVATGGSLVLLARWEAWIDHNGWNPEAGSLLKGTNVRMIN